MNWAIEFITPDRFETPIGLYNPIAPRFIVPSTPSLEAQHISAQVPGPVDLTAYAAELKRDKGIERILIASQGAHINLQSPQIDKEAQGYFYVLEDGRLFYKDGPDERRSLNGTKFIQPRLTDNQYAWDQNDWNTLRAIMIEVLKDEVYMMFPGVVSINPSIPNFLARVYKFKK